LVRYNDKKGITIVPDLFICFDDNNIKSNNKKSPTLESDFFILLPQLKPK